LKLDAAGSAEHGDATVEHLQRAIHLDREVDVAGGVDDVEAVVLPETGRRCRLGIEGISNGSGSQPIPKFT
jgi:hypothetical protein